MKTAVCCIVKDENAYLREFVKWYKKLKFDNIILYDNNCSNGENIYDCIKDYIDDGYVIVVEIKDKIIMQLPSYNDCIQRFGFLYDWIAFFDCDEHLHFTKKYDIKTFLSEFSETTDAIAVNWMIMDDNDMLYNDGRLLEERFTRIAKKEYNQYNNIKENQHIKTILRCNDKNIKNARFVNPHYVIGIDKFVTASNKNINIGSWYADIDFSVAYLKHFQMKTITEFLNNRLLKGAPDASYDYVIHVRHTIDRFFNINERTPEKEKIANDFFISNKSKIIELLNYYKTLST